MRTRQSVTSKKLLNSWLQTCNCDFTELILLASQDIGKDDQSKSLDVANPAEIEYQPRASTFQERLDGVLNLTGGAAVQGTIEQNHHFPTQFLNLDFHG